MRTDARWTTLEYLWRVGLRPLMWLVRIATVIICVAVVTWLNEFISVTGMAVFVAIYAVWEVGRSIRSITPLNINIARGEHLIVETGASVSIPATELERVIKIIGKFEAEKRGAA